MVHTEFVTADGRIDILLLNHIEKWAVIIENKIGTGEQHDQLGLPERSMRHRCRAHKTAMRASQTIRHRLRGLSLAVG
jgi:hypothetical protein